MLSKVFKIQWKYPVKDDWVLQVQQDLKDFDIVWSIEEIRGKLVKSLEIPDRSTRS